MVIETVKIKGKYINLFDYIFKRSRLIKFVNKNKKKLLRNRLRKLFIAYTDTKAVVWYCILIETSKLFPFKFHFHFMPKTVFQLL